jgi:hypothetical protein
MIPLIASSKRRVAPVHIGRTYRVAGYYTGDFIGKCLDVDRSVASFLVVDPLRRIPKVRTHCPFPACVLRDLHQGEHEFADVRENTVLEVAYRNAHFDEAA